MQGEITTITRVIRDKIERGLIDAPLERLIKLADRSITASHFGIDDNSFRGI